MGPRSPRPRPLRRRSTSRASACPTCWRPAPRPAVRAAARVFVGGVPVHAGCPSCRAPTTRSPPPWSSWSCCSPGWPLARGAALAFVGLTKFGPFILLPLFASTRTVIAMVVVSAVLPGPVRRAEPLGAHDRLSGWAQLAVLDLAPADLGVAAGDCATRGDRLGRGGRVRTAPARPRDAVRADRRGADCPAVHARTLVLPVPRVVGRAAVGGPARAGRARRLDYPPGASG